MKYCENCGTKLDDDARFCIECGTKCETPNEISIMEERGISKELKDKIDAHIMPFINKGKIDEATNALAWILHCDKEKARKYVLLLMNK